MFYTYAHYKPQGGLFYIGKGNGYRAYDISGRNTYWKRVVEKYGKPEVEILAYWDTEKEALDHEILLISCFKEMKFKLTNLTNGGEGTSGIKRTEEQKEKISKALKGHVKSAETIKKLSEAHKKITNIGRFKNGVAVRLNQKHTKESCEKMSESRTGEKNHRFGNVVSEETKAKIRAKRLGKHHSEETKAKMKAAKMKNKELRG